MGRAARHPSRYVWDFWYHYDEATGVFHVFYLNAPLSTLQTGEHHDLAQVGYAVTRDFVEVDWIDDAVLRADPQGWDNAAIWSGDVIQVEGRYLMFYTSRDLKAPDPKAQSIGLAQSGDFRSWERVPGFRLQPDPEHYESETISGDSTVHAWRDPFLFRRQGRTYMLLSAKSRSCAPTRKGAVALLVSEGDSLCDWQALPPLAAPGWYSEMEVPQLYSDPDGCLWLVYSTWARHDHAPGTARAGGLQALRRSEFSPVAQPEPDDAAAEESPRVLLPEASGLYACRVLPELDGCVVGFDIETGGFRKSELYLDWSLPCRDFSGLSVP